MVHDPDCEFDARLQDHAPDFLAREGKIRIKASPVGTPEYLRNVKSGSAIVARLATPSKSIITRTRIMASRLLQDRLPVNLN